MLPCLPASLPAATQLQPLGPHSPAGGGVSTHPCTCVRDTPYPLTPDPAFPRFLPSCLPQGVEIGIGIGVGLSLLMVIYKTAFPRITTLGRLPGTTIYRSERMYPEAESSPGLLILRVDGELQEQQLSSSSS